MNKLRKWFSNMLKAPALPTEEEARQQMFVLRPLLGPHLLHVRRETTTEFSHDGVWAAIFPSYKITRYYLEPIPGIGFRPGEYSIQIQRPENQDPEG